MPNNGRVGLSLINRFRKRVVRTSTGQSDLIAPPASPGFDPNPRRLNTALSGAAEVSVVVQATNPKEYPTTGSILIRRNDGTITTIAYTAIGSTSTTVTFTIGATDFSSNGAAAQNEIWLPLSYRCVITDWTVIGSNSNAAICTWTVRNKTTTANVLFGGSIGLTSGNIVTDRGNTLTPGTAGETLELVVAGAITGNIDIEVEGGFLPSSTVTVNEYTGAP